MYNSTEELFNYYAKLINEENIDVLKNIFPKNQVASASIFAKATGVVSGIEFVKELLKKVTNKISVSIIRKSGSYVNRGDVIATISGPITIILSAEKVILQLLRNLSGIASMVRKYKDELSGLDAFLYPCFMLPVGLEELAMAAFVDGGGMSESDNEYTLISSNVCNNFDTYQDIIDQLNTSMGIKRKIIIEVTDKSDFLAAIKTNARVIRVKSNKLDFLKECAEINDNYKKLEFYGDVDYKKIRAVAMCGYEKLYIQSICNTSKYLDIDLCFYKKRNK